MEEDRTYTTINGTHVDVTQYGLGARGIERIELFTDASSQSVAFPLYDGHGNMIATLARDSRSPHYMVANVRTYDAWGGIRSGFATGNPAQRYCANLGHRADDETGGLIYMRARYYEPWTGRFISEDSVHQGGNWCLYANSNPVSQVDLTGREYLAEIEACFRQFLLELSLWQGPIEGFADRGRQFITSMCSYFRMAWDESNKYFAAAETQPGEAGDIMRGKAGALRAEATAAMVYAFEMILALGLRVIDEWVDGR